MQSVDQGIQPTIDQPTAASGNPNIFGERRTGSNKDREDSK